MIGHAVSNVVPVSRQPHRRRRGQSFYGSSFIADHRGDKVAELGRDRRGRPRPHLRPRALRRMRASWGFFSDRRPELYGVLGTADGRQPVGVK
jgi:N-carbamoylputrescine amidase